MFLMRFIKKIYAKLVVGDIKESDKEPDVDEWLSFLSRYSKTDDYITNIKNKYACRQFHFRLWKKVLLEIAAFPIMIYKIISLFSNTKDLPKVNTNTLLIEKKVDVDYRDVIPNKLLAEYDDTVSVINNRDSRQLKEMLSKEAVDILKPLIRQSWYHPYLIIWCIRELAKHCAYIERYNIKGTVVYIEERNVASPLIRELYERTGRKFISFMHGEYLLRLIQGFMSFSEYYIWDAAYEEMFADILKCNIGKYVLYKPRKLEKRWNLETITPEIFCTYYFSAESKESIKKIADIFKKIESCGKICRVRPHPRYSQWNYIYQFFPIEMIEEATEVSIEESLGRTHYVVGLATTVLAEAYFEGRTVVIDDLSSKEKFNNLKKRRFICLNRPHILLSDLVRKATCEEEAE